MSHSTARTRVLGDGLVLANRGFNFVRLAKPKTSIICTAQSDVAVSAPYPGFGIAGQKMVDFLNSRDADGYLPQSPVDHIKLASSLSAVSNWRYLCSQEVSPLAGTLPPLSVQFDKYWALPSVPTLDMLCLEAFRTFNTQFPEEISIANFLWELREVSALIPKLRKNIVKDVANAHLTLEFGWKPLIGDLITLVNILQRVDDRLSYLRERYGKRTSLGFTRNNIWALPSNIASHNVGSGCVFDYRAQQYEWTFHAGGRLFHQLEWVLSTQGRVRALLGAFGLSNPAKIAWNAIPYSFVVDWMFNVSGMLSTYAVLEDRTGDWRVDRLCWSVKLQCVVSVTQRNTMIGSGGTVYTPYPDRNCGTVSVKRYYRESGLLGSVSSHFQTPSARQATLLAALLTGKS